MIMFRNMAKGGEEIGRSLKAVLQKVKVAAEQRPPELPNVEPRLVAVTKTKPVNYIVAAYEHGQRHFGENYVNELAEKSTNSLIREHCTDIKWHFIGHLQRNKSNKIAVVPRLYMVETVDNQKLAQTLSNLWEKYEQPDPLRVMVQVNTSLEDNKSGCDPDNVATLVKFVRDKCPRLRFCGLMTIGAIGYDPANGPNPDFLRLVECRIQLSQNLDIPVEEIELSMGMSTDYEHAISLGSTNVRVGSTIFGARNYPNQPAAAATSQATPTTPGNQSNSSENMPQGSALNEATPTTANTGQSNTLSRDQTTNRDTENVSNSIGELKLDDDKT